MTICYPQIITARICPRSELDFSLTPPTCVRVVPVYNDASYVISQFPPPVHFLVRDNGQVYQLADIQSPPSTPPEYHAILDSTGCILIGVELSAVTTVPLTNAQISVLPGVLRYVLQTLGLPLTSVINTLPPQRCRPQLWQQILAATTDCLNTPPPPPPQPPNLTCSFVLSCISPGQNINISAGGIISAGQLVPGPNNGQYTWLSPNGTPLFTFNALINPLAVQDTPTVDLTLTPANVLSANVNVSAQPGNTIQILPDGLFVGATSINLSVQDTPTVDLTLSAGNVLSASVNISGQPNNQLQVLPDGLYISSTSGPCLNNPPLLVNFPTNDLLATYNANTGCLEQIVIPSESVVYGEPNGSGSPRADNLLYSPSSNFLRATVSLDFPMQHSFMLYGPNSFPNGSFYSIIGATTNSGLLNSSFSFINFSDIGALISVNSVVVGQNLPAVTNSETSVLLFRDSTVSTSVNSFVTVNTAVVNTAYFSFVAAGLGASHPTSIFGSLSIAIDNGSQPAIGFSTYIARSSNADPNIPPFVSFSGGYFDSVIFDSNVNIYHSTLHLAFVRLLHDGLSSQFSFIAANSIYLNSTRYSFFASDLNAFQIPSTSHSFVSMRRQNTVRVGANTPFVNSSVVITVDAIPDISNAVFINGEPNIWLLSRNSVYVARNVNVFDSNPPNNTASMSNSVIVGNNFDVSNMANVDSLALIGRNLRAGVETVFGVGFNSYTPPAVINAGGWRAFIADGGADNANYFQGWASAWRFRLFNPATNYPNEIAATAALNAAYGADPRIDIGTMVVVRVAGRPAIFSWDGATFTRITT
jgi:hypothetical protein